MMPSTTTRRCIVPPYKRTTVRKQSTPGGLRIVHAINNLFTTFSLQHTLSIDAKRTCDSTSIAISINMSCNSRMLDSSFMISLCLASMSANVCRACCVSVMIPCVKTPGLPDSIISSKSWTLQFIHQQKLNKRQRISENIKQQRRIKQEICDGDRKGKKGKFREDIGGQEKKRTTSITIVILFNPLYETLVHIHILQTYYITSSEI